LYHVGRVRTPEWIREQIRSSNKLKSSMPAFPESRLPDRHLDLLVDYLSRLELPRIEYEILKPGEEALPARLAHELTHPSGWGPEWPIYPYPSRPYLALETRHLLDEWDKDRSRPLSLDLRARIRADLIDYRRKHEKPESRSRFDPSRFFPPALLMFTAVLLKSSGSSGEDEST
ncbi:MAG: hypothetical protein KY468_19930, partial [Armatimonadetes bacterium]|nr:hypothetical protein [Armatimonadota bacterium]